MHSRILRSTLIFIYLVVSLLCTWLLCGSLFGNDLWFHIRAGLTTLSGGTAWPFTDVFTYTYAGQVHDASSWLGGVLLALFWLAGGAPLLVGVRVLCNLGILLLGDAILRKHKIHFLFRAVALVLAAYALHGRTMRPWLFGAVLLVALSFTFERLRDGPRRVHGLAVCAIAVAWVNLHPSFPLMLVVLIPGLLCLGLERRAIFQTSTGQLLLAAPFALFMHPTPLAQLAYIYSSLHEAVKYRPDFLPTPIWPILGPGHAILMTCALITVLLCIATAIKIRRGNWGAYAALFPPLALLVYSFSAARFQWMLAPALYFALWQCARQGVLPLQTPADETSRASTIGRRLALTVSFVFLAALVPISAISKLPYDWRHGRPWGAFDFLQETNLRGRLFCPIGWAGQMLLAGHPNIRVFLDGRLRPGNDKIDEEYYQVLACGSDMESIIKKHRVNLIAVPPSIDPRWMGRMPGQWIPVYYDGTASIYMHRNSREQTRSEIEAYYGRRAVAFNPDTGVKLKDALKLIEGTPHGKYVSALPWKELPALLERAQDGDAPNRDRAYAYRKAFAISWAMGAYVDAAEYAQESLQLMETRENREICMRAHFRLGFSKAMDRPDGKILSSMSQPLDENGV